MDTHTVDLDGYRYVLSHCPGRVALRVAAKLGNAGASFLQGASVGHGASRIANAAAYLLGSPDLGNTAVDLCDMLSPYTMVTGKGGTEKLSDVFDPHFAGRLKAMTDWLQAAIEFECGDFLGEVSVKFQELVARASSDSAGQNPAQKTP